ncbi:MAG TPA: UvrB/UvrC motif-containing protein [Bacillales bacterium]|nr:UvrB/UvrC motif-containing protein [Bacillales bacterium]
MECQECHVRPATLHFTKIVNGEKNEIHICEQCAKEKGDFHPASNSFSIHHLLSGLLGFEDSVGSQGAMPLQNEEPDKCPNCGMTYGQFTKSGKFGCSRCYEVFEEKLDPIFRRVHGGNVRHTGKIPKRAGSGIKVKQQLEELRARLQEHIRKEEFEKAAQVRDQIRSLEKKGE